MATKGHGGVADGDFVGNEERATPQSDLREALLLAGISELETHGLTDFSLRRVAAACGVSCAAPYKHFESKEAFIAAILAYIREKRELLEEHLCAAFPVGGRARLVELCLADVRFWLGNPRFYTVHMMEKQEGATLLGSHAEGEILAIAARTGTDPTLLSYLLRSLVYGAVRMLADGTLPNDVATFRMLRAAFLDTIPKENP